ncbi:retinol dehydrogenase 16-like [Lacerta agilis]|uniref:retinol dehydrogenase 16-like n=1 Tax=Lacerta agilis TaxID=80427 RepID=UPI00141953E9|nr:retinol dehydrogenase 16-like [Lacerta agilis]
MWLYLAALLGLYFLRRWYQERQTVENLTEKYVFITGCDSGFGNLLARQLDARGLRVLAACLTQKGAEQLDKVTSERLKTTILDVTSTESVAAAAEWVKEQSGSKGLWGLVNNAGILMPIAPNEWLTKEDFVRVLDVNLLGAIDVTLRMLPLIRRAQGRLVNVSSITGRFAYGGGGYSPSKFALEAFSDSLRRELHPFGVKVSIIEPGGFVTELSETYKTDSANLWNKLPAEIKDLYGLQYWNNFSKTFFCSEWKNTDLCLVTNCMQHALTSCYPRSRYTAGLDAKFIFIPLSYLPASLADYIVAYGRPRPAKALC